MYDRVCIFENQGKLYLKLLTGKRITHNSLYFNLISRVVCYWIANIPRFGTSIIRQTNINLICTLPCPHSTCPNCWFYIGLLVIHTTGTYA